MNQRLISALKWLIPALVVVVLWMERHRLTGLGEAAEPLLARLWMALPMLVFSVLGIALEAQAWRFFVRHTEPMGLKTAFRRQWGALTWAFITPNNLGEYYARMQEGGTLDPLKARYNLYFNLLKLQIKALVALVALFAWDHATCGSAFSNGLLITLAVAALASPALLGWLRARGTVFPVPSRERLQSQLWMLARHLLVMLQLTLAFEWLHPGAAMTQGLLFAAIYLVGIATLPTFGPLDGLIKGTAALVLGCLAPVSDGYAAVAATLVWTANWALPALVGWTMAPLPKAKLPK
jgi:hypothetical protein